MTTESTSTPSLQSILDAAIASGQLRGTAARDSQSAVKKLAKAAGLAADRIPAAPVALRPIIETMARRGDLLRAKSRHNLTSGLRRLLRLAGLIADEPDCEPTPEWAAILAALPGRHEQAGLAAFARYCTAGGITPAALTPDALDAFITWRETRTLYLRNRDLGMIIRRRLGRLRRERPDLAIGDVGRTLVDCRRSIPLENFQPEFRASIDAVLQRMAIAAPFDGRGRPYSPRTAADVRSKLLHAAARLVIMGRLRLEDVVSVDQVVEVASIRALLTDRFEAAGGRWRGGDHAYAAALQRVARLCLTLEEAQRAELALMVRATRPRLGGISEKNADRLRAFDDPEIRAQLVSLPDQLRVKAAKALATAPPRAAKLNEAALAIDLLLATLLRRRNLAALDIVRHFRRDRNGRIIGILIAAEEVKNGRSLDIPLRGDAAFLARLIEHHIDRFRPHLPGAEGSALFPSAGSGPRNPGNLSRLIIRTVEAHLGVAFNPHLVRHLFATRMLEDDPDAAGAIRRALGHRDMSTTLRMYGDARGAGAHKRLDKLLAPEVARSRRAIAAKRRRGS